MKKTFAILLTLCTLAATLFLVPTQANAQNTGELCSGEHYPSTREAKDSYSAKCGITYDDQTGFHSCAWEPEGWICSGPQGESNNNGPTVGVTPVDGTITVNTLGQLRSADLPAWAKQDALIDLSLLPEQPTSAADAVFDWTSLSDHELAEPFQTPFGFDVEKIAETAKARANPTGAQARGLCGGRWKNKTKQINFSLVRGQDTLGLSPATTNLGGGFSAEFSSAADMDGTLEMSALIRYKARSNKCIGIPYRWEFTDADIDIVAEVDGALEVDNTLTLRYQTRLWEEKMKLGDGFRKSVPIASVFTVDIVAQLNLILALDIDAAFSITQTTKVNQDYNLHGRYESYLNCDSGGCTQREPGVSELDFEAVDRQETYTQRTLDITLTPSAELQLELGVDVSLLSWIGVRVFTGKIGVIASLPVRLYWTEGNACSDANGDGLNEQVSGTILDVTAQLSAYIEGRIGGRSSRSWISMKVPNGWVRGQLNDALNVNESIPTIRRNLYMRVLEQGTYSPLEPVITKAGLFNSRGTQFEGIGIGGVRDCYPFKADFPATYQVNWGDGQVTNHKLNLGQYSIAHDWTDDGRNRTVAVRVLKDNTGRRINGPWTHVNIDGNSNLQLPKLKAPTLTIGATDTGPALQWTSMEHTKGYNVYRDGQYIDSVAGRTNWSLAGEDGQQHSYTVYAFNDDRDPAEAFSGPSNPVIYGGADATGDGNKPRAAVSMGDSFISGEGGRWFGNAKTANQDGAGTDRGRGSYLTNSRSNGCHRSDTAEVQSAAIANLIPLNIACSGAEARHVRSETFKGEEPQIRQLARLTEVYDVDLIVLSIGGNDLGFGDILAGCARDYITGRSPCRHDNIYSEIVNGVVPKVKATVEEIKSTMAAAGDNNYRLVLQSYVSPLPRPGEIKYRSGTIHLFDSRTKNGCGFYDKDLDWARDIIVPNFDIEYRAIAAEAGIEFLSLRDAMEGKEVCARGTEHASSNLLATSSVMEAKLEWARWANANAGVQGDLEELLHPNALGQQALGRCLALTWARTGSNTHRCERGGNTPADMRVVNMP